ncbi:uncharacterized protein MYCFIDRAFT_172531 [Pseudocercospora fijiensis CIRAD86]|uniref:Uncharacterized protein n=1 Tax=Pseudocercospora fijiensis (strain CIRAD86) TaxID=383855 RepID=M3BC38_PSEFD|nr:uncharacterized protein MYCFIDRAFT_172531 [Pseudocercospora fijiensis CIRAD86]EME86842.1 hypothetical protein MYCFIDRAFT_172531 [Pseudocercospora fijiensis CIRAD86]
MNVREDEKSKAEDKSSKVPRSHEIVERDLSMPAKLFHQKANWSFWTSLTPPAASPAGLKQHYYDSVHDYDGPKQFLPQNRATLRQCGWWEVLASRPRLWKHAYVEVRLSSFKPG